MAKSKLATRKKSSRRQKVYKMKGCSKKTRKNYLGGSGDVNLAYPSNNVSTVPNPFLAYTGKGGSSCDNLTPNLAIPVNTNAMNPAYPNTGPVSTGYNFLNPSGSQRGGCETCNMTGGSCMSCSTPLMSGGKGHHRIGCKCSNCKKSKMMKGGNPGIPYPDGLVGSAWNPTLSGLPGVDGIQGNRNYLAPNEYKVDPQTAMTATGANPPFSIGGRKRRQKGGNLSNFLGQDLINLGRQFQFGVGSAYNALAGYSSPVNPMPFKDQLSNTSSLITMRAAAY